MGGKARATPPDASAWIFVFERWTRAKNPREKAVLADLKDAMLAELLADRRDAEPQATGSPQPA